MTFRPLHDRVVVRRVEAKEKKDRVDDAMHATKAAVEEGVVPGERLGRAGRRGAGQHTGRRQQLKLADHT
jgi:hypothetical protein